MRIFLTGGGGYLARALADRLRADGHETSGVDLRADHALNVAAGDVTRPGPWQERARECDVVIHTAAIVSLRPAWAGFWEANVMAVRNALDATAGRFVHFSSVTVFGLSYPDGADERWPVRPEGVPYIDTKIAAEQVVLAERGVEWTIVRPGDVYGPGSRAWTVEPMNVIRSGQMFLPRGGQIVPVYVDNLVEGVAVAALAPEGAREIFTLTDGPAVDVVDFMGRYADMLGVKRPREVPPRLGRAIVGGLEPLMKRVRPDGEMYRASFDYVARRGGYSTEKARRVLGWAPRVALDEGFALLRAARS
jgi:nucleoside-diphosphate-sugar epimerase